MLIQCVDACVKRAWMKGSLQYSEEAWRRIESWSHPLSFSVRASLDFSLAWQWIIRSPFEIPTGNVQSKPESLHLLANVSQNSGCYFTMSCFKTAAVDVCVTRIWELLREVLQWTLELECMLCSWSLLLNSANICSVSPVQTFVNMLSHPGTWN